MYQILSYKNKKHYLSHNLQQIRSQISSFYKFDGFLHLKLNILHQNRQNEIFTKQS